MLSPFGLAARACPQGIPGVRRVLRAGLARMFGPPPFNPHAYPGDPGLYGPGSATWQVVAEPAAIVGGVRALIVQLLHPLAMAGVADHSGFRADAIGRLQRTSAYVTTTAYGAVPETLAAARTVRRVHRGVRGTAPDGRPYSAEDPHLLGWVSVALTSSLVATNQAYAPEALTAARADAFVAEQSCAAALLDPRVDLDALAADPEALAALRAGELELPMLVDGTLPRSAAELEQRLAAYRPELGLNEQGRTGLRFLLWPDIDPLLRAGFLPLVAAAVTTVDADLRARLELPAAVLGSWPLRTQGHMLVAGLRLVLGTSPARRAAAARAEAPAGPAARQVGVDGGDGIVAADDFPNAGVS